MKVTVDVAILLVAALVVVAALYLSWSATQFYREAARLYAERCAPTIVGNWSWP